MKKSLLILIPLVAIALTGAVLLTSAGNRDAEPESANLEPYLPGKEFDDYWYQGEAELSGYTLDQARYGEMHEGNAVLVFVTENFSPSELTKGDGRGGTQVPVLKVNFDKKFLTGVYPYSMLMTSAVPVDMNKYPHALKVSGSVLEWCGHTYTQLNLRGKKYEMTEHSYFPGEGDQQANLEAGITEDELWVRIRIAPDKLPTGEVSMIPGVFYSRLKHQPMAPVKVLLSKTPDPDAEANTVYTIAYQDGSRSLKIHYQREFPHLIEGWEDTYESGWGAGAKTLTTTARRNKTMKLDYWNRHTNADQPLRKELGLE